MEIQELLSYNSIINQRLSPAGISVHAREIPPLVQVLMSYFDLRSYNSLQQFIQTVSEGTKNPQLLESVKTVLFKQQTPQVQQGLLNLLIKYLSNTTDNYASAYKNVVISSLLDIDSKAPIAISNISAINGSEVGKRIASLKGLEFGDRVFGHISSELKANLIYIIDAITRYTNGNPQDYEKLMSTLYHILVMCDGFMDMTSILSTLKTKALTITENAAEAAKKSQSGIDLTNDQVDQIKRSSMQFLSIVDLNKIIEIYSTLMMNEIMQSTGNQQQAMTSTNTIKELIMMNIPTSVLEDVANCIDMKPLKGSSSETRGIHLNAVLIASNLISMGYTKVVSYMLSYIIMSIAYKNSPSVVTTPTNITNVVNLVLQGVGLPVINQNIIAGDVNLKTSIRMDLISGTNFITSMYSMLNNDSIGVTAAQSFLTSPLIKPMVVYEHIQANYPHMNKGSRHKLLNVEFMDTYLMAKGVPQFTTTQNPNCKVFIESYVDALAEIIANMELN